METGKEAGERKRRFGQRERAVRPAKGVEFGVSADTFLDAEVDRAHDQFRAFGKLGKHLDGWLTVEVRGHVEHLATMLNAVRRGVGPATGKVEPDRAARPDNLVVHDVAMRAGGGEARFVGNHLPQPGKCAGLKFLPARLATMPQDGGAEHLVVDHLHRVVVVAKGQVRQVVAARGKGAGGGFEIEPEEYTPAKTLEHRHLAGVAQARALLIEATQVDLLGDLPGGEPGQFAPAPGEPGLGPRCRCEEPCHERRIEAAGIQDGEQRAGMDVGLEVDGAILGLQAARAEPLACRPVQPAGRGVTQRTGEGVVKTVGPHAELGLADGHEIEAHAGVKLEGPIVVRHAGEHMPGTELPPGRHHAVLDPEGVVALPAQGDIEA